MALPTPPSAESIDELSSVIGNNRAKIILDELGYDTSDMQYLTHPELDNLGSAIAKEKHTRNKNLKSRANKG